MSKKRSVAKENSSDDTDTIISPANDTAENGAAMSIAIVGMGCRYPGQADSADSFWQILTDGVDATSPIPADRWNNDRLSSPDPVNEPGSLRAERMGMVHDIADFDAGFFGISPREAAVMDPQQRIILETAYDALENAGQTLETWGGQDVGVFVGAASTDYMSAQLIYRDGINGYTNSGSALSIIANRISYQFDFKGPSLVVDTACSSSLTALDLACRSVSSGDCQMALVGGVNALLLPEATMGFSSATMLAPDGRCKTFDASADGYVRGEGAGVVVLKPLAAALHDQDRIYAVIKGSVVNQDGHTSTMTIPDGSAHEAMLKRAYEMAGITPSAMRYIEAHGTGTPVGDPIEVGALGSVLSGQGRDVTPCYIGSVKTNIGHLEAGAGVAGLIKASLAVHHGVIPASLNFQVENPDLNLSHHQFRVPTHSLPWPDDDMPRRAGVNSFGFGGTNAHVVIEQTPAPKTGVDNGVDKHDTSENRATRSHLLTISARSEAALQALALEHRQALQNSDYGIETYCRAAARRRTHHDHRLAIIGDGPEEFADKLALYNEGQTPQGLVQGTSNRSDGSADRPVFVFSGMGPQWWGMGRQLFADEPVFRHEIEQCDAALSAYADWSLIDEMMHCDEAASRMDETQISQPANFALQVALARLWQSWGVEPAAIIGHSAGEVAAAYLSGLLSFDDAVRVIYHRSRLQHRTSGQGSMMAVGLSLEDAQAMIDDADGKVSIGAVNGNRSVTLAGDSTVMNELADRLKEDGVFHRLLPVNVPFHSHYMDPLQDELHSSLCELTQHEPQVLLYSTVTGSRVDGFNYDAAYWWRNVREPVLFAQALEALIDAGHSTFLEISPHPVLSSLVSEDLKQSKVKGTVVASLRRGEDENEAERLLTSLAELYIAGQDIDWSRFYPGKNTLLPLPRYPWQRKHYWHEGANAANNRLLPSSHPLLGTRLLQPEPCWLNDLSLHRHAYLADHQVQGLAIFPAAGYMELALAAGKELYDTTHLQLENFVFEQPLVLSKEQPRVTQLCASPHHGDVSLNSRALGDETSWTVHMRGQIRQRTVDTRRQFALDALQERCPDDMTAGFYASFTIIGLEYGPCFQGISKLCCGPEEALAWLRPLDPEMFMTEAESLDRYLLHPSLLDACLQALYGTLVDNETTYLPVSFNQLRLYESPKAGQDYVVYARLTLHTDDKLVADIYLLDTNGHVLVELRDLTCQAKKAKSEKIDWLYAQEWERQDILEGIDSTWADSITPQALKETITPEVLNLISDHHRERYYEELEPQLDALAIAAIAEAFDSLGADWKVGDKLTVKSLSSSLSIIPRHHGLIKRFLQALTYRDLLQPVDEHTWSVRSVYDGPTATLISRRICEQFDDDLSELALIDHCRCHLPEVLCGRVDPLHVMFPAGSTSLTEAIYTDALSVYNGFVEKAVDAILQQLPENRQLRILEIGAGSGALASRLLQQLSSHDIHYTFTDVTPFLLQTAKTKFVDVAEMDFRVLDIEKSPADQGFELESFDIILASDVLHATKDLTVAVDHATKLLVPQGLLMLIEMTAPPLWVDLTFGQLKGWWAFQDTDHRPDHCCVDKTIWQSLLEQCGQDDIQILSDRPDFDAPAFHNVILSRRVKTNSEMGGESSDKPWLLVMDRDGIGDQISADFKVHGLPVISLIFHDRDTVPSLSDDATRVVSGDLGALSSCVGDMVNQHGNFAGLIYLPAADAPSFDQARIADMDRSAKGACLDLINLMKVLGSLDFDAEPDVVVVTRDVHQVTDGDGVTGVLGAPIWGLGRVIANEYSHHKVVLIDLPVAPTPQDITKISHEVQKQGASGDELALRHGHRYVARLKRTDWELMERAQLRPSLLAKTDDFYLDVLKPGTLDNFVLRQAPQQSLAPDEVEIEVHHASINFRDLMKVMDIYPDEGDQAFHIGDECSGIVRRVGSEVTSLAEGDRVAAIAQGFSSVVTTSAALTFKMPDHICLQDAATVPIAFLTAWYALHKLAQVQPGERVLIHAAAGGVGLAAVQIAQQAGAEVFATASSEDKHAQLASMNVQHIMNSRTLDFHDQILEATDGEGIDIVLNSLAGEFIPASMKLLRSCGRFVEIGKADIYQKNDLNLYPFRNNLTYFAVDLDFMFRKQPMMLNRLFQRCLTFFDDKSLSPLPLKAFDISEARQAFRYMAQAKHIGKIVFDMRSTDEVRTVFQATQETLFHKGASYLLTGGLGGFGLEVGGWMAANGAGHIILAGRRTELDEKQQARIQAMEAAGCRVTVAKLDITDGDQLTKIVDELCNAATPLKGVMHMAMVLDDRYIKDQNERRFSKAFEPKAKGAWHLHHLTHEKDLDFFVMFSSFAAIVGNPGQGNYVAANQLFEALAFHRQAQGLPALSLAWPPIADVGYVAEHDEIQQHFARQGVTAMTTEEALQALDVSLRKQLTMVSPLRIQWDDFCNYMPAIKAARRFDYLTRQSSSSGINGDETAHILEALKEADTSERQGVLQEWLSQRFADLLAYDLNDVDATKSLLDLGLDSLMAVQFATMIEQKTEITIPTMELSGGMSIAGLAAYLLDKVDLDETPSDQKEKLSSEPQPLSTAATA